MKKLKYKDIAQVVKKEGRIVSGAFLFPNYFDNPVVEGTNIGIPPDWGRCQSCEKIHFLGYNKETRDKLRAGEFCPKKNDKQFTKEWQRIMKPRYKKDYEIMKNNLPN